jgi:hypothetical protein
MKIAPLLAGCGLAAILLSLTPASLRVATAAPDNTLGMAMLGAHVGGDGTIYDQSGLVSATVGAGTYALTFDRPIGSCMWSAMPFANEDVVIRTTSYSSTTINLRMSRVSDGTAVNWSLFLTMFCPR